MTTITATTFAPDLSPFYGNLVTGKKYRIQAKLPFYTTVGHGTFSVLNSNQVVFSGNVNIPLIFNGNINLGVDVQSSNAGTVDFNGNAVSATFKSTSSDLYAYLSLPGKPNTSLDIQWWHSGLWIGGPGTPHDIWVG